MVNRIRLKEGVKLSAAHARCGLIFAGLFAAIAFAPSVTWAASAPSIDAEYATNVAAASATFNAEINPHGESTAYRLEYGRTTAYGQSVIGEVGAGMTDIQVTVHRQDLLAGTTYHYRFVASSECEPGSTCTTTGEDHTFTTQSPGGEELSLLDGRAWELVSPANKKGALIEPVGKGQGPIQAAADGMGMEYVATENVGVGALGKSAWNPTVALRTGGGGWRSVGQSAGVSLPAEGTEANKLEFGASEAGLFSPDLASGVFTSGFQQTPPGGTEPTVYLRGSVSGSVVPLVTASNVQPGVKFGGSDVPLHLMQFAAATPDLSYVVILSPYALVEPAVNIANNKSQALNVYEWHAGQLRLVNILPDGKPNEEGVTGARVGRNDTLTEQAISDDGRFIVWTSGELRGAYNPVSRETELYVRDMVAGRTLRVGGSEALFEGMSRNGSKVFYLENGELDMLETTTGTSTDLTSHHGAGENSARVQDSLMGMSNDGSYVYFVAKGVLAQGGSSGEDNLYALHDNEEELNVTHIATLSAEDEKDWHSEENEGDVSLGKLVPRVSSDGRFLAFMSEESLTGYDNVDAVSGQPDEEVYLYDARADRLVCVSCNPTGARPSGVLDDASSKSTFGHGLLVDRSLAWVQAYGNSKDHWLAGSIPSWYQIDSSDLAVHQPRFLSDSGRVFFDSPDALVAQDTNGLEDVYEYEPVGVGSCSSGSVTFSERSDGCVDLVSSGTSFSESAFMDASESGDDAFFVTASKLVGADYDTGYDLYDAHVCSTGVPCVSEPAVPPPCTSGDSCKAAPSPQPEIFGAAPSATFSGTGNLSEPPTSAIKPRSLSRAQRLARALRACKRQGKRERAACARRARKRYAVKHANAKSGKRGSGR